MENLILHKVRLSVLWLIEGAVWLAYLMFVTMEPGVLEQIMAGKIEGMEIEPMLLLFGILFLVVLIMAFLSLTLKDSTNRWVNIIVGIVIAVFEFVTLIDALAQPYTPVILMTLSKVVVAALIVWYAWKWPKKKD